MRNHRKIVGRGVVIAFISFIILCSGSISSISTTHESSKHLFFQSITADNTPPNPPEIIGPTSGKIKEPLVYSITLTDIDEDILLNLEIMWGDGTEELDCGCGKSWRNGSVVNITHTWRKTGDYSITARIQDSYGAWSNWSEPLPISIPKQKTVSSILSPLLQTLRSISNMRLFLLPCAM